MNNSDLVKQDFQKRFKQFGDSPQAMHWLDKISQEKRFQILIEISNQLNSVIDVGCGTGHLYKYLLKKRFKGKYLGLDFVPDFIHFAKNTYHLDQNAKFRIFDLRKDRFPQNYDYLILSGVFNNKMSDNKNFMLDTITKMFQASKKGIAFNAMSTYVDYCANDLYYSNPLEVFDFCKKNLTKKVTLRHDYMTKKNSIPYEYAIYLYK